jgi:VWFA-related protein
VSVSLACTLLAVAGAQAPPVFRAEVGIVRVEVSVTRNGSALRGLSATDFELRDNGRVQKAQLVVEEDAVDVLLVLDMSRSVGGPTLDALKNAARAFLDGLREGEQAAVVAFREEVLLLEPFTADRDRVRRALDRAEPRGSTALRDAVYAALRLHEPGPRRTAVVVFSDGRDSLSWLGPSEVIEAASRSQALVYGVATRGRDESKDSFLGDLVRATGGRLFDAASQEPYLRHNSITDQHLRERFLDVLADIRARYVLSFTPEGADTTGWHTLDVKLRKVKGDVLARPRYWR